MEPRNMDLTMCSKNWTLKKSSLRILKFSSTSNKSFKVFTQLFLRMARPVLEKPTQWKAINMLLTQQSLTL